MDPGELKSVLYVIKGMYTVFRSRVRANAQFSEKFWVAVDVHQKFVFSHLLFILVLSLQIRTGLPWGPLYADDLVVMADAMKKCIAKLKAWQEGM